jgi:hypothetical protein
VGIMASSSDSFVSESGLFVSVTSEIAHGSRSGSNIASEPGT